MFRVVAIMIQRVAARWRELPTQLGSIRARLTFWYVALLAVTVTGYSAVLVVSLARGLDGGLDRLIGDQARQAAGVLATANDAQELAEEFRMINVGTIIGLYDASGEHLLAGRTLPEPLDRQALPDGLEPRIETLSLPDGRIWRVFTQRVSDPEQSARLLVVARSAGFIQIAMDQLITLIVVTGPLALLLAIAGGFVLTRQALNPIDQIARTAAAIGAEDLSRRLAMPRSSDEVGRLASTFDHMLDRLDQAFERERRFTADASHELRTPLAMLVSRAGLTLERRRTSHEYEDALRTIRDDGLRMGRIVSDLLMLARSDAGDALALTEQLDAGELVAAVADAMAPRAEQLGIKFAVTTEQGVVLLGDQTRLTQLLVNLLENALTHTPSGSAVGLSAACENGRALLRVSDTGTGIAPEHLPHVFQRFFRGDRDRSRADGGAGLGLALCQSIVLAHGGEIDLESEIGFGTRVTIRLPLAGSQSDVDTEVSGLLASSALG